MKKDSNPEMGVHKVQQIQAFVILVLLMARIKLNFVTEKLRSICYLRENTKSTQI